MSDGAGGIRGLCWSVASPDEAGARAVEKGALYALWPSPPPPNEELRKAGVKDFAEPTERWWAEFRRFSEILLANLRGLGDPKLTKAVRFRLGSLFGLKASPRQLIEETVRAAGTPGAACRIEFGSPAKAVLNVPGRPVWELWLESADEEVLLRIARAMAQLRGVQRVDLDWSAYDVD